MPKAFLTIFLAVTAAAIAALFIFQPGELSEIKIQETGIGSRAQLGGVAATMPLPELDEVAKSDPGDYRGQTSTDLEAYIGTADRYLEEALVIVDPKQRFVLIEKIDGFKESYEGALEVEGDGGFLLRATSRYIATWSPFYYKIHSDAVVVLGKVIKILEGERVRILGKLARHDARRAGRLAAEDIEYYIEDIRKSAARRNSDFIAFSILNYEQYKETFDELSGKHEGFLLGFAEQAHILFDDFYRMHEEVDPAYGDKTRKEVEDVRLGLRDLHRSALVEFARSDPVSAREVLEKTTLVIEQELSAHPPSTGGWRSEIYDIMKSDYAFYESIQL